MMVCHPYVQINKINQIHKNQPIDHTSVGCSVDLPEISAHNTGTAGIDQCEEALLFVMFYPILSGAVTDRSYVIQVLQWLPGWQFCY